MFVWLGGLCTEESQWEGAASARKDSDFEAGSNDDQAAQIPVPDFGEAVIASKIVNLDSALQTSDSCWRFCGLNILDFL